MQSQPILAALGMALNDAIKYYCQVDEYVNKQTGRKLCLCLSKHSIFILNEDLSMKINEIFYANVMRLFYRGNMVKLVLSDDRLAGIPQKFTVKSSNASELRKHIKCYWEIDFMWRRDKIKVLSVEEDPNLETSAVKTKNPFVATIEKWGGPDGSDYEKLAGYGFFITHGFKVDGEIKNEFTFHKDEIDFVVKIIIEPHRLVENITEDLKTKAETSAEDTVNGNEYAYIKNDVYHKRLNLTGDWAVWSGHEILLISENRVVSIFVLRRKFIPPLLDSGQDIIIQCTGTDSVGSNYIESVASLDTPIRKIASVLADSIHSRGITQVIHQEIVQQKCENLIMNEEMAAVYSRQYNTRPSFTDAVYRFVLSVCLAMQRIAFNIKMRALTDHIQREYDLQDSIGEPEEEFKELEHTTISEDHFNSKLNKIRRYIAYCVNGGLFQNKLNIRKIAKAVLNAPDQLSHSVLHLKRVLIMLLNPIIYEKNQIIYLTDTEDYRELLDFIPITIDSRSNSSFNQDVMLALIESRYMKNELQIRGNHTNYPNLVKYLLTNPTININLKAEACLIVFNSEGDKADKSLKDLIVPLAEAYSTGNSIIATHAAFSLSNIIYNNKENKKILSKHIGLIEKQLNSNNEKLLSISLVIMTNLITESKIKQKIIAQDLERFLTIAKGFKYRNLLKYNDEVITRCLWLLSVICDIDKPTSENMLKRKDYLETLKEIKNTYIGMDNELEAKTCNFFKSIYNRALNYRKLLQTEMMLIESLMEGIETMSNLSPLSARLMLLSDLAGDSENIAILKSHGNHKFVTIKKLLFAKIQTPKPEMMQAIKKLIKLTK